MYGVGIVVLFLLVAVCIEFVQQWTSSDLNCMFAKCVYFRTVYTICVCVCVWLTCVLEHLSELVCASVGCCCCHWSCRCSYYCRRYTHTHTHLRGTLTKWGTQLPQLNPAGSAHKHFPVVDDDGLTKYVTYTHTHACLLIQFNVQLLASDDGRLWFSDWLK